MTAGQAESGSSGRWVRGVVWAVLLTAAVGHLVFLALGVGLSNDTAHLETPLALAAAGQFTDGPGVLYGPFRGANHRVLVHAPLYYRLTGALAWPLVALAGAEPFPACLLVGRLLSLLAGGWALATVGRLAVLDGAPRRAGAWAAALGASSWVVGTYWLTVRPDMLGAALQTAGALGVVRVVLATAETPAARPRGLARAAVALALAFCVKQHDVAVAAVSLVLLVRAGLRARRPASWWGALAGAVGLGLLIVAADYGTEEFLTSGGMSRCVFVLSGAFGRVAPGGLVNALAIGVGVVYASFTLIGLAVAARVARPPRAGPRSTLDGLLACYLTAEVALAVVLCTASSGAWLNYAIQGVFFACVLVGRALARAVAPGVAADRPWRGRVVVVAVLVLLGLDARTLVAKVWERVAEEVMIRKVVRDPRVSGRLRSDVYFAGMPGYNRRFGRFDLTHDEWLYGLFEQLHAAEPRSVWLRPALARSLRVVVVPLNPPIAFPTDPPVVPGMTESLPELGYEPLFAFGRYRVWERRREMPEPPKVRRRSS